jgi:hypothetical protein
VNLAIAVRTAAVRDDHEAAVGLGGGADGREEDAARGGPGEDERVDVVRAQDHF